MKNWYGKRKVRRSTDTRTVTKQKTYRCEAKLCEKVEPVDNEDDLLRTIHSVDTNCKNTLDKWNADKGVRPDEWKPFIASRYLVSKVDTRGIIGVEAQTSGGQSVMERGRVGMDTNFRRPWRIKQCYEVAVLYIFRNDAYGNGVSPYIATISMSGGI